MFDPSLITRWVGDIFIFLFGLVAAIILFILSVFTYAWIRSILWQKSVEREARKDYARKHRPDGTPLPPTSRGLCDSCEKYADEVYFLDSGRRLCSNCFAAMENAKSTEDGEVDSQKTDIYPFG